MVILTFVFSCLHLLSPKKRSIKYPSLQQSFSALGPCLFPLQYLFCLSHRKPVGLCQWIMKAKYVFWGPQTPWSLWDYFLGVNRSGPRTTSTTNHKFYKSVGRLHDPWCKQLLSGCHGRVHNLEYGSVRSPCMVDGTTKMGLPCGLSPIAFINQPCGYMMYYSFTILNPLVTNSLECG